MNEITTHILWKKHEHWVHSVGGKELVLSLPLRVMISGLLTTYFGKINYEVLGFHFPWVRNPFFVPPFFWIKVLSHRILKGFEETSFS